MNTDNKSPLVAFLERIAADEDRATLAALRHSMQDEQSLDALSIVLPYLRREASRREEDDAVLLAGLFATHPESSSLSLASALRIAASESDSVELRFRALLSADREDLPTHLRNAVSLVGSRRLGIDWNDLYTTIKFWDHESDRARRTWAKDFWTPEQETQDQAPVSH